jgi:hypothetical protein
MIKTSKAAALLFGACLLTAAPLAAQAAPKERGDLTAKKTPDGEIQLSAGQIAVGVGFVWGKGALTYNGQEHALSVSGLSVIDVGAAHISASGSVYDLKRLEDFAGIYTALSAGATVGGGGNAIVLRNQNGVVLKLKGTSEGLRFNLAVEGLKVKLKD